MCIRLPTAVKKKPIAQPINKITAIVYNKEFIVNVLKCFSERFLNTMLNRYKMFYIFFPSTKRNGTHKKASLQFAKRLRYL